MNTTSFQSTRRAGIFAATVLLTALHAHAQDAPPAAPPTPTVTAVPAAQPTAADAAITAQRGQRLNVQGGRGGFGGNGLLDDKQRELLNEATANVSEEIKQLEEKLRDAQKELVHVIVAEKYDEKVVREKADVVSKLQTELTMLRAKAFASVSPTLKPEQRDQIEGSRAGLPIIMGGGTFGGGFGGTALAGGFGGGFGGPGGNNGNNGNNNFGGRGGNAGDPAAAGGFAGRGGRGGNAADPAAAGGPGGGGRRGGGNFGGGNGATGGGNATDPGNGNTRRRGGAPGQ